MLTPLLKTSCIECLAEMTRQFYESDVPYESCSVDCCIIMLALVCLGPWFSLACLVFICVVVELLPVGF